MRTRIEMKTEDGKDSVLKDRVVGKRHSRTHARRISLFQG